MIADVLYAGGRSRASNLFSRSWLRARAFRKSASSLSTIVSLAAASACKCAISRS
jgi:hypothetical protein